MIRSLQGIGDMLTKEGIILHDCRRFLSSVVLRKGQLTARAPSSEEQRDIASVESSLGRSPPCASARPSWSSKRGVVAVEAIEGTDAAIRRGGALGNGRVVVVKVGRPDQDMRFDLPVVGPDTLAALEEAGATVLALDADQTLMLDQEKVVMTADRLGLAIVAD